MERKRSQEKRRRQEFKEALDGLHAVLLEHDANFRHEALQREERVGGGTRIGDGKTGSDDSASLFNRVELVNQAIFTIKRVTEENIELSKTCGEDGKKAKAAKSSRFIGYHQGVGPVTTNEGRPKTGGPAAANDSIIKGVAPLVDREGKELNIWKEQLRQKLVERPTFDEPPTVPAATSETVAAMGGNEKAFAMLQEEQRQRQQIAATIQSQRELFLGAAATRPPMFSQDTTTSTIEQFARGLQTTPIMRGPELYQALSHLRPSQAQLLSMQGMLANRHAMVHGGIGMAGLGVAPPPSPLQVIEDQMRSGEHRVPGLPTAMRSTAVAVDVPTSSATVTIEDASRGMPRARNDSTTRAFWGDASTNNEDA